MRNRSSHPAKHGDDSRRPQRPQAESRNQRPPKSQHAASSTAATKKAAKAALQEWDDDIAHLVESSIVTPRTVRASLVLVLAMAVALLYNYWEGRDVDAATSTFLQAFCQEPDAACHPRVGPRRRSQQAIASVPRGDTIVTVPRRLLVLDVDALQDPYLLDNWAGNTRIVRGAASTMDAAAYLAVYLSRLLQARKREAANRTGAADDNDGTSSSSSSSSSSKAALPTPSSNSLLAQYLDVLASANVEDHPLALNESFVERHLAGTSSLDVWRKHRVTIASEYERLAEASPDFARSTSYEEYRTARLLVLTRAFGTGPPPSSTAHRNMQSTVEAHSGHGEPEDSSSTQLIRTLEAQYNVDLSMGSYAMVPVLDFYDHHASPNVGFEFKFRGRHGHDDSSDRRRHHDDDNDQQHVLYADGYFHITALQTITPEATLHDSYGMRTDSDLFARYGFLQGDGTDCTQASLALHPLDFRPYDRRPADVLVKQRGLLLRYLQYDDGYLECVNPVDKDAGNAYELKRLKYLYLLRRADSIPSWTVVMHPRTVAGPPKDRNDVKAMYPPYNPVQHPPVANGTSAYTTCRVISLMDADYDGRAVELLSNLANDTSRHSLPALRHNHPRHANDGGGGDTWEDALEYRTLHCMTRLISASLQRLNTTLDEQMDALRRHPENQQTPVWSWHFAQLKLGEVATLMHLREIVHGHLRNKYERFFQMGNIPGYAIHRNGCPRERLDPIFELYGTGPL
jgi:hypothetical protein